MNQLCVQLDTIGYINICRIAALPITILSTKDDVYFSKKWRDILMISAIAKNTIFSERIITNVFQDVIPVHLKILTSFFSRFLVTFIRSFSQRISRDDERNALPSTHNRLKILRAGNDLPALFLCVIRYLVKTAARICISSFR